MARRFLNDSKIQTSGDSMVNEAMSIELAVEQLARGFARGDLQARQVP
jgi:hypothetical protein